MTAANEIKSVDRTSLGLRELLFDEIDSLRKGTSNPQRANAVAKAASQIINSVKLELDYGRHLGNMGDSGSLKSVPILTLGSNTTKGGTDA